MNLRSSIVAHPRRRAALALLATSLLAGCMVGPNYVRPSADVPVAYKELDGWKPANPSDHVDRGPWWDLYGDPLLSRLEAEVVVNNQNLKAFEAAYRQARAIVAEAQSGLYPSATFNPEVSRQRASNNDQVSYNVLANASWEPDIWGSVRRQVEGNTASAQASAADLANARLSAQADLANYYFLLRYQDSLKRLLNETATAYQRSLQIARNQYEQGTAARSDVITAETQLLSTQARAIAAEVDRAKYEHAIALLVGKTPSEVSIPPGALTDRVPKIPVGLPSTLLERRPDIAAAERTMQAQNAQIGVATAAFFPNIDLSASAGFGGGAMQQLLTASNQVWSLAASGAQILFDGGLRTATVAAAQAGYEQSVANYRQTVLAAFQDVEDELSSLRILARQIAVQRRAVASAQQAVTISLNEYQAGTQDYTTVVQAQTTALSNEQTLLQARSDRVNATVSLIRALGGGWETADLPTAGNIKKAPLAPDPSPAPAGTPQAAAIVPASGNRT
ncbi:efflux transporter, outer membrane factor (OMF) lipoprotein, NodT family [Pseudoxanthobacter soli DSM 19599]|uniref:Efflux transporter, outer membrane factor (OMF) lipoprotein, NodT family n=1 Tax=Pseudoxanthobacter soli DSM 19599 TaxID=1123029 RepID=A0A1M7ZL37_9HYPH|nr:efflux transporter outer membrane subunit [Pseudoxanthobacter soli]SHO65587.1 efflux transporter, outer membrane factor (OMF) lipoprotein, NodT family [Pseudoxanthobacter soli DSM 19599]